MRHNGAAHLRSPARELNFIQYQSFDVFAFFIAVILALYYTSKFIVKKVCCSSTKKDQLSSKKDKTKKLN